MKNFFNWAIDQLRQPSTWRGIVMLATSAGLALQPDMIDPIIIAGTGVAGLIGVLFKG